MFANAFLYGLQLCLTFLSRRLHLAINTFLQISAELLTHLTHFFYTLCLQTQLRKSQWFTKQVQVCVNSTSSSTSFSPVVSKNHEG